jgi:WG containing repeat
MKKYFLLSLFICFAFSCFAQSQELLYRYEITKNDKTLYGYKNKKGKIIFPAKYGSLGADSTFNNIIAVMEQTKKGYESYYLLRNGKKILKDSLYQDGDYNLDTEQEGMIRFQTRKPYSIGFLNEKGKIVIPNIYNYASAFTNGFAVTLQGATKTTGEHWHWKGGKTNIINKKNEIIITNFTYRDYLIDWYSLKINEPVDTNYYVSFTTTNNKIYSFIDKEKQFNYWLENTFKNSYTSILKNNLFELIEVEKQMNDTMIREFILPNKFDSLYGNIWLQKITTALQNKDSTIQIATISEDYLVGFEEYPNIYKQFQDKNGRFLNNKFPMYTITLNYYKNRETALVENKKYPAKSFDLKYQHDVQEAISFIRIGNTYKLVSVVQRK